MLFYLFRKIKEARQEKATSKAPQKRNSAEPSKTNDPPPPVQSCYKSTDGKGILTRKIRPDKSTIAVFEIGHEDGQGTIRANLKNSAQIYMERQTEIIQCLESGKLDKVETLLKQIKNIDVEHYNYRFEIFRLNPKRGRIPIFILDFELKSSVRQYDDMNASNMIKDVLLCCLNLPKRSMTYEDRLDLMFKSQEFLRYVETALKEYSSFTHSQSIKVIYSRWSYLKKNINLLDRQ